MSLKYHNHHRLSSYGSAKYNELDGSSSDEKETIIGCRSRCCFNRYTALALVASAAFFQAAFVSGVTHAIYSTLEKRFDIKSEKTAWISSSYDIFTGVMAVFLGYLGTLSSKPRWLMISSFAMCFACIMFVLPEFLSSEFVPEGGFESVCSNFDQCFTNKETKGADHGVTSLFYISQMFWGVGGAVVWSIGPAFIDDSVSKKQAPLFLAFVYFASALGVSVGIVVSGASLRWYVRPWDIPETLTDYTDSRWVGNWWINYLFGTGFCAIIGVLFALYPSSSTSPISEDIYDSGDRHHSQSDAGVWTKFSRFGSCLWQLCCNPLFMLISLGVAFDSFIIASYGSFMAKIFENQFLLAPSSATLTMGVCFSISMTLALLSSAIICHHFEPSTRSYLIITLVCNLILFVSLFGGVLHCPTPLVYGSTRPYANDTKTALTTTCNANCHCNTDIYDPVCDLHNGIQYFSPCHAGCLNRSNLSACACDSHLKLGVCHHPCDEFAYYVAVIAIGLFFGFFQKVPLIILTMRTVDEQNKAFALGFQGTILRILGTIPGPLVLGSILDDACLIRRDVCDEHTQSSLNAFCQLYDNTLLSTSTRNVMTSASGVAIVCFSLAFLVQIRRDKNEASRFRSEDSDKRNLNPL